MRTEVGYWADALVERLRAEPLLRDVASEAQDGGLGLDIKIDREKAGRLGISMQAISDTLNDAFGQRQISTIFGQANQYRVILEALPEYQRDPATLSKLYLPAGATTQQPTLSSATSNLALLPTTSTNLVPLSASRRSSAPPRRSPSSIRTSSRPSPSASTWRRAPRSATPWRRSRRREADIEHAGFGRPAAMRAMPPSSPLRSPASRG